MFSEDFRKFSFTITEKKKYIYIQTQNFSESLIFARALRRGFAHFGWAHAQIFSLRVRARILWLLNVSTGKAYMSLV